MQLNPLKMFRQEKKAPRSNTPPTNDLPELANDVRQAVVALERTNFRFYTDGANKWVKLPGRDAREAGWHIYSNNLTSYFLTKDGLIVSKSDMHSDEVQVINGRKLHPELKDHIQKGIRTIYVVTEDDMTRPVAEWRANLPIDKRGRQQ
jgi:hypothetical protein